MKLVVVSHKVCWPSKGSQAGYATDGGFPFQMRALSELFESTALAVPCAASGNRPGGFPLAGKNISVAPLTVPRGSDLARKLQFPFWLAWNLPALFREVRRADAVHAPIPGDIGTIGIVLAVVFNKPLFVRHCGNWFSQRTLAETLWKWFMERFAGGKKVMLATGGAVEPPSRRNSAIRWIFSTTLTESELASYKARRDRPNGGSLKLVIACRQDREKGTGVVIESLPSIAGEFPGVSLDVAGDGPALSEFVELADRLDVADRVTFHGRVEHTALMSLLKGADLFCYPTTASEGFPKVVHEALACGLPVITTRVSVLPQLIGTGCGILIDQATPEALARAVRECLVDGERYAEMSRRAAETAWQYSLERWRDTIGDALRAAWAPLYS